MSEMTEPTPNPPNAEPGQAARKRNLPLPGVAAIACLLLLEAGATAFSLLPMYERRSPATIPVAIGALLLFAGGAGLLRQKRWGWALALSAALITVCYSLYLTIIFRTVQFLIPAALHMVFFLYLVRPTVRVRMR
jgi:uncharacterized membrane protein (DUF2068 family)